MPKRIYTENYRRIWESHYGTIPKDDDGRTYEIHHIDGDSRNNDISNLKCVSIKDHYDIHHTQGDWWSCYLIAQRMDVDPKVLSDLSKKVQKEKIENGTHPFQSKDFHARYTHTPEVVEYRSKKIKKKTQERVKNGTHNFMTDGHSQLSSAIQKELLEKGTHNFIGSNEKRIKQGTHNLLGKNRDSRFNFPKGYVNCVDTYGNPIKVTKETYANQSGDKTNWEYVHCSSKEAKRRRINR
jgi:hypothetical protein